MSGFFALVARMKHISRWALMRNTHSENLCEHSFETAVIAHALCVIGNERFGKQYNADRAAVMALYHDFTEVVTGDMPTPVKYRNDRLKAEYKSVEREIAADLLGRLPQDMQKSYREIMLPDESELLLIVKAADKLSALIKCVEEQKAGNGEFSVAKRSCERAVLDLNCPEAEVFLEEFLPSYSLTLDELQPSD